MMDDNLDLEQILKATKVDVPLQHEQPTTTLESLMQIRGDFLTKLEDAKEKKDTSKMRRYDRQIKQYDAAIKSTKEGRPYNYAELTVPPGFAAIPLNEGKAVHGSHSQTTAPSHPVRASVTPSDSFVAEKRPHPSSTTALSAATTTPPLPSKKTSVSPPPVPVAVKQKPEPTEQELSDDLLQQLENELDDDDDAGGDELNDEDQDPEYAQIKKQLESLQPNIKKIVAKESKEEKIAGMEHLDPFQLEKMSLNSPAKTRTSSSRIADPHLEVEATQSTSSSSTPEKSPQTAKNDRQSALANKNLLIVQERQRLFKEAALKAKQEGNTSVALVYLRHAKVDPRSGFEAMISAAESGMPLDMNNLPVPPQLVKSNPNPTSTGTKATATNDSPPKISGDRDAIFKRLEEILAEQIRTSTVNYKHFTHLGDVANANAFKKIYQESVQDLDALKISHMHGKPVPLYHYEKRSYQTVDCNSDLTDNDLEIKIIRAINIPLPKDFEAKHVNSFVKFEFPYPPESVQSDRTSRQNGTLNPEFNQKFNLQIQRNNTKFVRIISRKELKLEIYYKAGFLKGDKLLCSCSVKLNPLSNTSTIHDAFDLYEGRKHLNGKLEVHIRIREPLVQKQVKTVEHRWLIIDKLNAKPTIDAF